jgi:lysophospholipase L1-like esterase
MSFLRPASFSTMLFGVLVGCSSPSGAHGTSGGGEGGSGGQGGTGTGGGTGGAQGGAGGAQADDASLPADVAVADAEGIVDVVTDDVLALDQAMASGEDAGRADAHPAADRAPVRDVAGTDGSVSSYDPCPPKGQACVVLPLGDSLTQGAYSSGGGYRRELFREVVAHGQSVTFVGSQAAGPAMLDGVAVPFPRHHEGHGGYTIEDISTWLTQNNTIATYKPDVVLLHIGTNNGLRHPGPNIPSVLTALGKLIDQIVDADPHLLVIVAQIIPSKSADGVANIATYDAGIPAVVAARAAAGKHVIVADIHSFFVADPNWKTDYLPTSDVHPIDAGYDAMGRGWYSVLGPLLR